ncbi:SGNH/GDSL hydrolase family protein [Azospirillum soli]|uniref:SGNH/GDSL hydrolase family protein n=1 Tax=Azospirillum soli TaxID=1304799 RepID=UPI001FE4090B|nr:GDSL-type esterase/lipase family protein [Azospirillum soli]MBP2312140.1 lysophospholipase L1-like esterase [Azospirillum soli]
MSRHTMTGYTMTGRSVTLWRVAAASVAFLAVTPFIAGRVALSAPTGNPASACAFQPQAAAITAPLPHLAGRIDAGGPLRIVAIGSSSTAGAGASRPDRSYPARLAELLQQRLPGVAVDVLNKGVNGEVGTQMLRRFQRDVLDQKPDLVIWQVGANTVLRGEDPGAAETVIRTGIQQLKAAGMDVVLMDLQYAPAMLSKPTHEDMQARIARIAEDEGVGLFRRFAAMRQWVETRQASMSDLVGPDGIHLNDVGYDCLARSLSASLKDAAGLRKAPVADKGQPPSGG